MLSAARTTELDRMGLDRMGPEQMGPEQAAYP